MIPLLLITLLSASGLLIYAWKYPNRTFLDIMIAFGAGSMLSVALAHILPEALEQTETALYAFIGGFVLMYLIEEFFTPHSHSHKHEDHSHEDPHSHTDHIAVVSFVAIFLHTILDGMAIRASFGMNETIGYAILIGVALHQIPVSLSLASIFRESRMKRSTQGLLLMAFALAPAIGYIFANTLFTQVNPDFTILMIALAGGSLLYVATVDLLPVIHGQKKHPTLIVSAFIIGVLLMTGAKELEGEHHHSVDVMNNIRSIT